MANTSFCAIIRFGFPLDLPSVKDEHQFRDWEFFFYRTISG